MTSLAGRGRTAALLLVLNALGGCSLAGRTFGAYVDDQTVTAAVKMGLARKEPRNLTRINVDTFEAPAPTARPIDHVSVYGVPAEAGLPEAQMYIVFWHVSAAAAAALR